MSTTIIKKNYKAVFLCPFFYSLRSIISSVVGIFKNKPRFAVRTFGFYIFNNLVEMAHRIKSSNV